MWVYPSPKTFFWECEDWYQDLGPQQMISWLVSIVYDKTKLNDSLRFLVHQTEGLFLGGVRFLLLGVFFLNIPIVQWYVYTCGTKNICQKKPLFSGTNQPTNQPTNPPTRSLPWMLARLQQWVVKRSAMQEDEAKPLKARVRWSTRWCPGFLGPNISVFGWEKMHELTWWHVELILGMVTSMIRKSNVGWCSITFRVFNICTYVHKNLNGDLA